MKSNSLSPAMGEMKIRKTEYKVKNMKNLLFLMMCMPLLPCAQEERTRTDDPTGRGIKFEQNLSWEQIKARAKSENKYIFLDAYTTWCVPCKMMDKEVYPNDTVGQFINEKFISVKVQMDSTGRDNEQVKRWYADARAIEKEFKVIGYPSYLFFNPAGTLIYKALGYKNVPGFIKLANQALDPQNILYYSKMEDYQKGKKNYKEMYDLVLFVKNTIGDDTLARQIAEDYINHTDKKQLLNKEKIFFVQDVAGNRKLADSLAKEYKDSYLNKLSEDEFCTSENLRFIELFNHLITSRDKIFQLSYSKPEKIDSITGFKGSADYYVHSAIIREELISRLFKDDKPLFKNPDWNKLSLIINKKYPEADIKELVLNYQIYYYGKIKDCPQWARYQNERIKSLLSKPAGMQIFYELNDLGAWRAFLNCNDEKVLVKALEWIELAIKLSGSEGKIEFLDTRANVLYKLGRVKEAIAQEEKAIETGLARSEQEGVNIQLLMSAVNNYREILDKMRKGEPTYVEQRAVWAASTLQKIRGRN